MVHLLAPHLSALQTDATKFKQDFIGPLFIDTALDKTLTPVQPDGKLHKAIECLAAAAAAKNFIAQRQST